MRRSLQARRSLGLPAARAEPTELGRTVLTRSVQYVFDERQERPTRPMRSAWSILAAAVFTLPACVRLRHNEAAHQELLSISRQVRLCMPSGELDAVVRAAKTNHLERLAGDSGGWVLVTPLEFGAKNWYLYVDAAEGYVTSVRFRTEDSYYEHPSDAPPDRFTAVGQACQPADSVVERADGADGASRRPRR